MINGAQSRFSALLPSDAAIVEATDEDMWSHGLLPEEAACLRSASHKRLREFTAGRNCARGVLELLGCNAAPILVGESRQPILPAEAAVSVTHSEGYCAAAGVRKDTCLSIGIDTETNRELDVELRDLICTGQELVSIARLPRVACDWHKLVFSAKESLYKAWYPLCHRYIDFLEVTLQIDPRKSAFSAVGPRDLRRALGLATVTGRYLIEHDRIYTAVTVSSCVPLRSSYDRCEQRASVANSSGDADSTKK
jgi:4'-phosphopantetheinyl transferase EntD